MKTISVIYQTNRLVFTVNDQCVSLSAFLKSAENYEESSYIESLFRERVFLPNSPFRKSLSFTKQIEVNQRLNQRPVNFIALLEYLYSLGLAINKNGLK